MWESGKTHAVNDWACLTTSDIVPGELLLAMQWLTAPSFRQYKRPAWRAKTPATTYEASLEGRPEVNIAGIQDGWVAVTDMASVR